VIAIRDHTSHTVTKFDKTFNTGAKLAILDIFEHNSLIMEINNKPVRAEYNTHIRIRAHIYTYVRMTLINYTSHLDASFACPRIPVSFIRVAE